MRKMRKARARPVPLLVSALAVGILSLGPPAGVSAEGGQRAEERFKVGEVFPDLALPSLEGGSPARLSDFRGHKVMLHVFASW